MAKVFCEASYVADVELDEQNLQKTLEYIVKQSHVDGAFFDDYPVWHREMQVGTMGKVFTTCMYLFKQNDACCV